MSRRLSFYFDFGAEVPLWWDGTGAVEPSQLPLSDALIAELRAFQTEFWDNCPEPGEPADPALILRGRELLTQVKRELGPSWQLRGEFEFAE